MTLDKPSPKFDIGWLVERVSRGMSVERKHQKEWYNHQSEKARGYYQSNTYKARMHRYQRRYYASAKGRTARLLSMCRYWKTAKGKATRQRANIKRRKLENIRAALLRSRSGG